jgi:SAM-dependent methyltransferase
MPDEHLSNQLPPECVEWLSDLDGWVLNIGAGGSVTRIPNCIELEYSIFRHTDVVADAHHLPFGDKCLDAVVSLNTFEHLIDPHQAAAEIRRVLKPGGRLMIRTAFLQPLHEPPYHFYNTTEYGLRHWFRDFDITEVTVSPNFQPAYVLAWLSSEILRAAEAAQGPAAAAELATSNLGSWRSVWEDPLRRSGPHFEALAQLPQELQKRFAAGFQMEAVNRTEGDRAGTKRSILHHAGGARGIRSWLRLPGWRTVEKQVSS